MPRSPDAEWLEYFAEGGTATLRREVDGDIVTFEVTVEEADRLPENVAEAYEVDE